MHGTTRWRGQASTIGVALIIGITIAVAVFTVALGSTALTDTEQRSQISQAEQALTQFDSTASQVALGDSDSQQLDLGPQAGAYSVREGAGTMKVIHVNYDGTTCDDGDDGKLGDPDTSDSCGDDDFVVHEQKLGAVEYQQGDVTMAYQGGGVWRIGDGEARMVSPPEFHYRAATLTFPIVTVSGTASGAGGTTASIVAKQKGVAQYPAPAGCDTADCGYPDSDGDGDSFPSDTDGDDDGGRFTNPVQNGYIEVQITSEYAAAWEQYFRARTEGEVSRTGDTVTVELISVGGVGDFAMPPENTPLPVRGVSDSSEHPVNEFTINLSDSEGGNKDFGNAHWSFYAGENEPYNFEMAVHSGGKCKGNPDDYENGKVQLFMYYENTTSGVHEEWQSGELDPDTSSAVDVTCREDGDDTMTIDWMDAGTNLEYRDIENNALGGGNNKFHYADAVQDTSDSTSATLDDHSVDPGNVQKSNNPEQSLEFLTDHYIGTLPQDFEFEMVSGPNNGLSIDPDSSTGTFDYDLATSPEYVTYLHVSENEVEVTFD